MILSHGTDDVYENKDKITRFKFFTDFAARHGDGIYGLDRPLMQLVNTFKSAALGYGTERRVILLHGPVGSAKSTIARLLKRGLEEYSRTDAGQLFSASPGRTPDGTLDQGPDARRAAATRARGAPGHAPRACSTSSARSRYPYDITIKGDLSPFSRYEFKTRLPKYDGDWLKMLEQRGQGLPPRRCPRRTASASAPSSRRTRRTRTRPS